MEKWHTHYLPTGAVLQHAGEPVLDSSGLLTYAWAKELSFQLWGCQIQSPV